MVEVMEASCSKRGEEAGLTGAASGPPTSLSIDTKSTYGCQGNSIPNEDRIIPVITPEGSTLVHNDNLSLEKFDVSTNLHNFSTSSSDGNCTGNDTVKTLTIATKPVFIPSTGQSTAVDSHIIPTITLDESALVPNENLTLKIFQKSASPPLSDTASIHEDTSAILEVAVLLPSSPHSQESRGHEASDQSPTNSSASSATPQSQNLKREDTFNSPILQQSSVAKEALLTFRNKQPLPPELPPPITRGLSLDSSHPPVNRIDSEGFGIAPNTSNQDEFSNSSSTTFSDGDGSYFSEHLPSPKSAARQTSCGNRIPPGHWNRTEASSATSHFQLPTLGHHISSCKVGQESDLSLSTSSSDNCLDHDDESLSTLGNAYPLSRTHSAPSAYSASTIFRSSHRPPMMPLVGHNQIHQQNGKQAFFPPIPSTSRRHLMEKSSDRFLSHTTTTNSSFNNHNHAGSSEGKDCPCGSSMVSSSSEDLAHISLPSYDSLGTKAEVGAGSGDTTRRRDSKQNDLTNGNKITHRLCSKTHRRQSSNRSVGSIGSGYNPDASHHKCRSKHNRRTPQDESDCDSAASESSNDLRYYSPHVRSLSNGVDRINVLPHSRAHVPIEVNTLNDVKKGDNEDNLSPCCDGLNFANKNVNAPAMTEEQIKTWTMGLSNHNQQFSSVDNKDQIDSSPDRRPSRKESKDLNQIDSSPDRKLNRKESSDSMQKGSSAASVLNYSEDDTDESARFRGLVNAGSHSASDTRDEGDGRRQIQRGEQNDMMVRKFCNVSNRRVDTNVLMEKRRQTASSEGNYDIGNNSLQRNSNCRKLQNNSNDQNEDDPTNPTMYTKYPKRWAMLFYMSVLNLLSDWTCYSVAPISVLTGNVFETIQPEVLVTLFLATNAIATAFEPTILSRLGLRNTVVLGAFLLMIGSVVKSGGVPGLTGTVVEEWRIYAGFLLVGLSQPLYQCTPALLSSSWFPEEERTLATGVALNANQLGIGLAFIVGTKMVNSKEDIATYFDLLSTLAILAFVGCFIQFSDAPPTPPSGSARVIRGSKEVKIEFARNLFPSGGWWNLTPSINRLSDHVQSNGSSSSKHSNRIQTKEAPVRENRSRSGGKQKKGRSSSSSDQRRRTHSPTNMFRSSSKLTKTSRSSSGGRERGSRRNGNRGHRSFGGTKHRTERKGGSRSATSENGFRASPMPPSPTSNSQSTVECQRQIMSLEEDAVTYGAVASYPMMSGRRGSASNVSQENYVSYYDTRDRMSRRHESQQQLDATYVRERWTRQDQYHGKRRCTGPNEESHSSGTPFTNAQRLHSNLVAGRTHYQAPYQPYDFSITHEPMLPYVDMYQLSSSNWQGSNYGNIHTCQQSVVDGQYDRAAYLGAPTPHVLYDTTYQLPPTEFDVDDGAEPVLTQFQNKLRINIRDDQVIQSMKACFFRTGFVHSVVVFAVGGVVINTLSTYMDHLVRLGESDQTTVGTMGVLFQLLIMISGIVLGKLTDTKRAYYSIVLGLLVLGALFLAECAVHLDSERGIALRWSLLFLAVMIGPLQPIATELGVEVAYPLSENTVLVIQQLFSNLISALFIPFFRAVRSFGVVVEGDVERPQYVFSFYLLILIHATAAVFFTTFNGTYLRLEQERRRDKDTRQRYDSINQETMNPRFRVDINSKVQSRSQQQLYRDKDFVDDEEQQAFLATTQRPQDF